MERFLITTSLQNTWPSNEQPVLFLGEWCKLYSERDRWSEFQSEIAPYHWDDRNKLYSDYQYLDGLYERVLPILAEKLNDLHSHTYPLKYWRVVIGPWLIMFLQIIFDRWEQIKKTERTFKLSETIVTSSSYKNFIPFDMGEFANFFLSDSWNHFIYSYIIKNYTHIPVKEICTDQKRMGTSTGGIVKRTCQKILRFSTKLFNNKNNVVVVDFSLSKVHQLIFALKHGIVSSRSPELSTEIDRTYNAERNWQLRFSPTTEFEKLVSELIPLQVPSAHIESYLSIENSVCSQLPLEPSVIATSYVYHNEVLKLWIAKNIIKGTKLLIAQHGGGYGIGKWFTNEDHELKISDVFLSWGWRALNQTVVPFGKLENPLKKTNYSQNADLLLVLGSLPRYSYKLYSETISGQFLNYFNDQCHFIEALTEELRRKLIIKLYPADFGWNDRQRFIDKFADLKFVPANQSITVAAARSKLIVSTYNSTTFLESLSKDIPTIIFWDKYFWELREQAIPFFEELKSVGIFHENPESAAKKIEDVWQDIDKWWHGDMLQKVRARFVENFCIQKKDSLLRLSKTIQALAQDNFK